MKTFAQMKEELAAAGGKYYPKHWTIEDIGDYLYKVAPDFRKIRDKQRGKDGTNKESKKAT